MTLGERIKKVRRSLDLTQQRFGERLGMKQNTIALIESGRNTSEQTIISICREFNVSETWLRTGEGEMFIQLSRDEEIASFMGDALSSSEDTFKKRLIAALSKLDEKQWAVLEQIAAKLVEEETKKD